MDLTVPGEGPDAEHLRPRVDRPGPFDGRGDEPSRRGAMDPRSADDPILY